MEMERRGMMVFAGNSHPDLAQSIARKLGISLGALTAYRKTNRGAHDDLDVGYGILPVPYAHCRETNVEIGESVRGRDVYIIQTGTKNVNNDIMELLILAYACKTSSARKIIGVLPYLPYCKQSKMRKRGCIVSKLIAKMFTKAGIDHVITMDLHQKEIQGFFDISVDNLRASPFLLQYIQDSIPDYRNAVIVARNPNSVKRATSYAERLRLGIAVIHGEEKTESERDDGRNSPPPPAESEGRGRTQTSGFEMFPVMARKEKPAMNVVGDVGGRIAILVDDLIDDVESFVLAADILKERGAYKIYVMATHGLLSSDAPTLIESSEIDEVVVTNTVPHEVQKMQCHKIKTVDISIMLCESIRRIHNNESMSYLFKNISTED